MTELIRFKVHYFIIVTGHPSVEQSPPFGNVELSWSLVNLIYNNLVRFNLLFMSSFMFFFMVDITTNVSPTLK